MLQPRLATSVRRLALTRSFICPRCRHQTINRAFTQRPTIRSFTSTPTSYSPANTPNTPEPPAPEEKDEDVFVPKPLGRPIGFKDPPRAGENLGLQKQKKDYTGLTLKQANLEKRKDLVEKWGTSYFRDWKNIRKYRSGKTFIANPRIFKQDAALYFPNLHGDTLEGSGRDTTPVLEGKVSVVNVYSSQWGETQVQTFTGKGVNPELHAVLEAHPGVAQMVDVNIEENSMKAWIIALFKWQLKMKRKREEWGRYFVVRRGVTQRIRETIGLLNGRVGYVYLLDKNCKIRWAGSANAEGTEMEDLNKGLRKLVAEAG